VTPRYVALGSSMAAELGYDLVTVTIGGNDAGYLPLPRRVAPLHPNAAGMRAVADLIIEALHP